MLDTSLLLAAHNKMVIALFLGDSKMLREAAEQYLIATGRRVH